jgi:hypothetical protein
VRLRSCVAIELALGLVLAVAVAAGGILGARELRAGWEREASAGRLGDGPGISWSDPATLTPSGSRLTVFEGVSDERLLEPLRDAEITRVKFNSGGSSISLRLDFDNGARAAFKPRQTNWQTIPRKEVAAFRVNRLLGLNSVPPSMGRLFRYDDLLQHVDPQQRYVLPRLRAEIIQRDGWVAGELSWWIPVIGHARVDGFAIDSVEGIVTWKRYLTATEPIPHRQRLMVAQISDMVLFDFVINNVDLWSGGNARTSPDGKVLYFMDNTLSLGRQPEGHVKVRLYMRRVQKFSRSLVRSLRELREEEVRETLLDDTGPFDELLTEREIDALMGRRDYALRYIDDLITEFGEEQVLVFR